MKHIVVQDIKSETKVGKSVYLFDFFFEKICANVLNTYLCREI